ncbi:MAG: RagB/SusD family nutrient uptake outer membrane protein [Lutibacter sp.]|uniref:RagB/SusD family nutrient uptake outer membrane protein n=1 Tax=Lutibacter sp. TaxID=1925666 RepID=UPI00299D2D4B|nr:RagB/SusD family nutrient uptake outer membrane protein [Lutibacter sp.]MDX1829985.1 RagB/SusD family nutrient uptake outer membrane protein [Lutibacter sp.]
MKKIFYILFASMLIITLASCEKDLDTVPFDAVDAASGIKTANDVENTLLGAYGRLRGGNYYGGEFLAKPDILSDNLIINPQGRLSNKTNYEWRYNPNVPWSMYTDCYRVIYSANLVLKNIDKAGSNASDIEGEALALRALAHFDALRVYAQIPVRSGANATLGLPYVTEPDPQILPARETVGSNYANLISDLTTAASKIGADNGEGRMNKAAVYALLSRVYLYMGEWQNASDAADNAIANSNTPIASRTDFPLVWKDASREGVLFLVRNTSQDGISVGVPYSQTSPAGTKSEYVIDYDFYQMYVNEDVRKSAYIFTSVFEGNSYNNINKYLGRLTGDANVVDMKVLRMAEVYLNKAEALAELDTQDAAALAALDVVRSNRYSNFTSPGETGTALKNAIKKERRLELAFEGHRFFDLKRWGQPVQRSNYGEFSDGSGTPSLYQTLPADDYKFQLPIPQDEINVNPNVEQNPGY